MTDLKLANEARKRAKSHNVERSPTSLTRTKLHLIRSLVREANEEMKAALGIDDSQSQLANNRGTRSKKLTENFRFLSVISPVLELNVQRVSRPRGSLLGFSPDEIRTKRALAPLSIGSSGRTWKDGPRAARRAAKSET